MSRLLAALRLRGFARDERGAVVVEFALILPLFVLFVFAIMEFARGYQALNAIQNITREDRYRPTMWLRRRALLGLSLYTPN